MVHTILVLRTGAAELNTSSREMAVARRDTVFTADSFACSLSSRRVLERLNTPGVAVMPKEGTTWLDAFALVMTTSLGTPPMTATIAPRLHSFFSTAKAIAPLR